MSELDSIIATLKSRLVAPHGVVPADTAISQAAVALILRSDLESAELLVIKRALAAHDHWSGNLALPGGRHQAEDVDLCVTAIRETQEEVGIDLSNGEILGRFDTLTTRNPLIPSVSVTPFVAVAPPAYHIHVLGDEAKSLEPNHEVAAAFWVPIRILKQKGRSEVFHLMVEGARRQWPAYSTEHGPIWGMTESILTTFLALLD